MRAYGNDFGSNFLKVAFDGLRWDGMEEEQFVCIYPNHKHEHEYQNE
jgi:hypothetical protein